jgi:hypothetical protein
MIGVHSLLFLQLMRFPHTTTLLCRYDAQDSATDDAQPVHRGNVTLTLCPLASPNFDDLLGSV